MKTWKPTDTNPTEPNGHYGGVEAADIFGLDETKNFVVSTMTCPPTSGGDLHVHDDATQMFFVISGSLTFSTGESSFTLESNEAVLFEPGDPHSTINSSEADAIVLVVTVPSQ